MNDQSQLISNAFQLFLSEAPGFAQAWGSMVQGLAKASVLDEKTRDLSYLAVLASLNRLSGIPFHVASLKSKGATREEIVSAILVGLPAAGHIVTQALPVALEAYDAK